MGQTPSRRSLARPDEHGTATGFALPVAQFSMAALMKFSRSWIWLLPLLPIALGLARLRFDVEVLNLLPGDMPTVQGLKIFQQNFASARELIITVQAPTADQAEATAGLIAETISKRTTLASSVTWQPPWIEHPGQAAELIADLWLNQAA